MNGFSLIKASIEYADEIASYRREFIETCDSLDGTGTLRNRETPEEWISDVNRLASKETLFDFYVQSTQFLYVRESDNKVVGMIDVRHYFNDFLEQYGGHIGYSIRPSERRKGYATAMLRESLKYCREIGLIKILVTCLKDNEVSRKIILSCGGIYERTAVDPKTANHYERYWITLYSKNETFTGTVTKNIIG